MPRTWPHSCTKFTDCDRCLGCPSQSRDPRTFRSRSLPARQGPTRYTCEACSKASLLDTQRCSECRFIGGKADGWNGEDGSIFIRPPYDGGGWGADPSLSLLKRTFATGSSPVEWTTASVG